MEVSSRLGVENVCDFVTPGELLNFLEIRTIIGRSHLFRDYR